MAQSEASLTTTRRPDPKSLVAFVDLSRWTAAFFGLQRRLPRWTLPDFNERPRDARLPLAATVAKRRRKALPHKGWGSSTLFRPGARPAAYLPETA